MSDLISRQAAIDALERKKDKNANGDIGGFYNKIIQNDIDALMQLPSAQPKTGRWINVNEGKWNTIEVLKCTACGEIDNRMYRTDGYCPNCGASMVRGEEDE